MFNCCWDLFPFFLSKEIYLFKLVTVPLLYPLLKKFWFFIFLFNFKLLLLLIVLGNIWFNFLFIIEFVLDNKLWVGGGNVNTQFFLTCFSLSFSFSRFTSFFISLENFGSKSGFIFLNFLIALFFELLFLITTNPSYCLSFLFDWSSFCGKIFWPIVKWFIFIFIWFVVFPPCITIQFFGILFISFFSFSSSVLFELLSLSFDSISSINKLIEFVVEGIKSWFFNPEIISFVLISIFPSNLLIGVSL